MICSQSQFHASKLLAMVCRTLSHLELSDWGLSSSTSVVTSQKVSSWNRMVGAHIPLSSGQLRAVREIMSIYYLVDRLVSANRGSCSFRFKT